jgi:Transmembrane domain of unknown function (DUF3566)
MTETQAQSGTTTSATPEEAVVDSADGAGAAASGRAVVGRASVPADGAPKFTRPEGMTPPPVSPDGAEGGEGGEATAVAGAGGASAIPPYSGTAGTRPTATRSATGSAPVKPGGFRPGAAGKVSDAVRAARATVTGAASRGPRRARLFVKRIDPWSVMKFSFAVSFVLFFVAIVATSVLYLALDAMGVFDSVNKALADIVGASGGKSGTFKVTAFGVIGTAGVIGLVNVVLFTALATLGSFIYNVCADLVGGIEVTLSEKD